MANNTHAVGQLQGYIFQVDKCSSSRFHLMTLLVCIEALDDVAVQTLDGAVIAEQIKSVTSGNNPVTDRSIVLWKTLYNWFTYVHDGSLVLDKTTLLTVVVSSHGIKVGDILDRFYRASSIEEAKETLIAAIS